jgi:hypothetical protein
MAYNYFHTKFKITIIAWWNNTMLLRILLNACLTKPRWWQTLSQQRIMSVPSSHSWQSTDKPAPSDCSRLLWPPTSPDLNTSDYFLQSYLKDRILLHTVLKPRIPTWSEIECIFIGGLTKVLHSFLIHGLWGCHNEHILSQNCFQKCTERPVKIICSCGH